MVDDQFDFGFYWSSSEFNLYDAWAVNFVNLDVATPWAHSR